MTEPGRVRARLREHERVVAVSVATALLMTGQGIMGPVLPLFARDFGVGLAAVGGTVAAFALARLLLNVPLGILADLRGRRLLLVGGPLVYAVGMAGAGFSGGIVALTAWRFVQGAGSAMYMTGAMIYLADVSAPHNRARVLGVNQAALLFGASIGPGIGGLIAERFGLRAPFFVVGAAALLAFAYSLLRLPETRPEESGRRQDRSGRAPWRLLMASPAFLAVALVNLSVFVTRGTSRNTLMPLAGTDLFGLTPGQIGAVLTGMSFANMVLLPPASYAADRYGRRRVILPSLAGMAVGLVLLGISTDLAGFLGGAAVLALATSLTGPAPAALAADVMGSDARGVGLGIFRTAGDLGLLVGPPVLGAVAEAGGYGAAFVVNAGVVMVALVAFAVGIRTLGPPVRRGKEG